MENALGYTQMRLNYIRDYAKAVNDQAVRMEMAWGNRDNFADAIDVEAWIVGQKEELEGTIESLLAYLQPLDTKTTDKKGEK